MRFKISILIFLLMSASLVNSQYNQAGVSHELAVLRAREIKNINYQLSFVIPEKLSEKIEGIVEISFELLNPKHDLFLDFQNEPQLIKSVLINKKHKEYRFEHEHIIIPLKYLKKKNTITIHFIAGESSLNRNKAYLFSLFVPDKASVAFPCFDQPDLKATFELDLHVPAKWIAASNAKIIKEEKTRNGNFYQFNKTHKISTYLFAFVAGEFFKVNSKIGKRSFNLYHREFDSTKVAQNIDSIFSYHASALKWMEDYTGIPYPFEKLDFVSVPSFQFSGMEHVGIIYYRDSRIFLSKSATLEDVLKKALVISHETSHMWFGDLVTMKWFDDVWLKEVYAELLASKMVNPFFQEMDHQLNFIVSNYPRAYQTDRSIGTNPIKQNLENLKFAGTLYGDIIYYKAPIVMANLEFLMGEKALQNGLREYLKTFSYANASWDDLIKILDKHTDLDLSEWSRIWVEQEGMPTLSPEIEYSDDGKVKSFRIIQSDGFNKGRLWEQKLEILFAYKQKYWRLPVFVNKDTTIVDGLIGWEKPDFVLLNGGGYGYGYFELDSASREFLLDHSKDISDNLVRTISYLTLYQEFINYKIHPERYISSTIKAIKSEKEKQNTLLLLDYLNKSWWQLLSQEQRLKLAVEIEGDLYKLIENEKNNEVKSTYFQTLVSIFISKKFTDKFYHIWKKQENIGGLKITETDYSTIAIELSLRDYPGSDKILLEQLERISDPDRKAKMRFIMPSVSTNPKIRDEFFESLKKPENRQQEIWVRTGLYYLNHPLRADYSIKYLQSALEMLEEIQKTGDIFFPKNWLAYTIGRYNTTEAADIVTKFLEDHPDYNKNLKAKILQLSDILYRAEKIVDKREHQGGKIPLYRRD